MKFNLTLAPSSLAALDSLAEPKGKTRAQALRDAIGLSKYISDSIDKGDTIIVERAGKQFELLLC